MGVTVLDHRPGDRTVSGSFLDASKVRRVYVEYALIKSARSENPFGGRLQLQWVSFFFFRKMICTCAVTDIETMHEINMEACKELLSFTFKLREYQKLFGLCVLQKKNEYPQQASSGEHSLRDHLRYDPTTLQKKKFCSFTKKYFGKWNSMKFSSINTTVFTSNFTKIIFVNQISKLFARSQRKLAFTRYRY